MTESKYSLISSFAALLYDYGDIGVSSPNRLLIFQYLLTATTFDDEVSSHVPNLVFYSEWLHMLGEDGLEASLVTWQDPLLIGQFISSQLTLSKH